MCMTISGQRVFSFYVLFIDVHDNDSQVYICEKLHETISVINYELSTIG